MSEQTVMIIGAAQEHCLGIQAAKELGLHVFVTDGNPHSVGFSLADASAVASTYDPEATLETAREYIAKGGRIDGVMTLAADIPYTVAYVADRLKLPGIGIESALNASEKIRMKRCFQKKSVPMPQFQGVNNAEHLRKVAEEFGFPVVVKPVDSRGARGVQLIQSADLLEEAYTVAHSYSPTGRVMVEQYLPGPQFSTEGFMLGGQACIPAIFDRNYEYLEQFAPFIVEDGGEMPSVFAQQYRDEIHEVMQQAALALGIKTGIIKGDLVLHEGRMKVIEIAARLSGGFFGTVATPASCGVDLVKVNIKLCLGRTVEPKELEPRFEKAAAIRFAFPPPGKIRKVVGLERILEDPACSYAFLFAKEGDTISSISNHPERPAVVVARGDSLDEAIGHAKRLVNSLDWDIEREVDK